MSFSRKEDEFADDANDFGVSNYAEKNAIIENAKENGIGFEDFEDVGKLFNDMFTKDIPRGIAKGVKAVQQGIVPGFLRRLKQKKIHDKLSTERDRAVSTLNSEVVDLIKQELENKKAERARNQIVRDLIAARKHLREEVKDVIQGEADKLMREQQADFERRRRLELEDLKAQNEKEKKEAMEQGERDAFDRQRFRVKFFSEQSQALAEETKELRRTDRRAVERETSLDKVVNDWDDREYMRAKLQIDDPELPHGGPIGLEGRYDLGVFGVPMRPGDYARSGKAPGDEHDVHPLSASMDDEYERRNLNVVDTQGELMKQTALLSSLDGSTKYLADSLDSLASVRSSLERDLKQVQNELKSIDIEMIGPPRRLPTNKEKLSMHAWKERENGSLKRIKDVQYAMDKAEHEKRDMEGQSLDVKRKIAVLNNQVAGLENVRDEYGKGVEQLPVIVGRKISDVPTLGLDTMTGAPKEALDAISHKSRIISIKDQSQKAVKMMKERHRLEQDIWTQKQDASENKLDMERMFNRLASINERLRTSVISDLRVSIIESLGGFLQSEYKLKPLKSRIRGMLPWYKHLEWTLSNNCCRFISSNAMGALDFEPMEAPTTRPATAANQGEDGEADDDEEEKEGKEDEDFANTPEANGVTLDYGKKGYCSGTMTLPKNTLWSLLITVTTQGRGKEYENEHMDDMVIIRIGPSYTSLSKVGEFYNKINPETGTVLYDVKHMFRGETFAYRFDFISATVDPKRHLAVCAGVYEEYQMKELEVMKRDPNNPKGGERVLSSYIKMLKVDIEQGKMKETRLLEELISCEDSKQKMWDSNLLQSNYMQRYGREYFLRILRAEILMQQDLSKAENEEKKKQMEVQKTLMANADIDKEAKLEQSMKKYMMSKRAKQGHLIDAGRDLIGKRLMLWDNNIHKWRNITCSNCIVAWKENGLKAAITHRIQEYDDGNEPVGKEFGINLNDWKWYVSPIQEVDEETLKFWREQKSWRIQALAIDERSDQLRGKLDRSLARYKKRENTVFEKKKTLMEEKFENSIDRKAEESADTPVAYRVIKSLARDVAKDVLLGKEDVDLDLPVEEKTAKLMELGRERYVSNYVKDSRRALASQIADDTEAKRQRIVVKVEEVEKMLRKIKMKAKQDHATLHEMIQKVLRRRKAKIMKYVKFDPLEFRKSVPVSYGCEHIKTKAWGNNYGKGIRCVDCGIEISELWKEDHQILGYGSGSTYWMYDAINRHRRNEVSFKFKNSAELQLVEKERRRLEKERREIEEEEAYFYDFEDLKYVYEFDSRHQRELKRSGVFRQGVHWTEEELDRFMGRKRQDEKDRLVVEGLPEHVIEDFDALGTVPDPPPTFRGEDERRRAQYKEMQFTMGRLRNFMKKISEFKMLRMQMSSDVELMSRVSELLHKDAFKFDNELTDSERDLDKTSRLLGILAKMERLLKQSNDIRTQANKDLKRADMRQCGSWDTVKECKEQQSVVHDEVRQLLKSKLMMDRALTDQVSLIDFRKSGIDKAKQRYHDAERTCTYLKYCMPGNIVWTRFGECVVTAYRPADDMILVLLPFGNPPAKAYIYYREIVNIESTRCKAETLMMENEDNGSKRFYAAEKISMRKARFAMAAEEEGYKQLWQFEDMQEREKELIRQTVQGGVDETSKIIKAKLYIKQMKPKIQNVLTKMIQDRQNRIDKYKGPKSGKPKKYSMWEKYKARKEVTAELNLAFMQKVTVMKEDFTKSELEQKRNEWLQTNLLKNFIDTEINIIMNQIAEEAISEGRVAKGFAERKSGIIFPHPPHMSYGTYASLAAIWTARKEDLKYRVEIAKGETSKILAGGAIKQKIRKDKLTLAELKELVQKKKAAKQEEERQTKMCTEMLKEEILCKDFYRWELKENLRERRNMKAEEVMMEGLKRAEEKARLAAGSVYAVTASSQELRVKDQSYENRRQELKQLTLERRRTAEEHAHMIIEDKLSFELRELDRLERQRKAFNNEYGIKEGEEEEEEEEFQAETVVVNGREVVKVPDWMRPPLVFFNWDFKRQNAYVRQAIKVYNMQQRVERKALREKRLMKKLAEKSFKDWYERFRVAESNEMEAELEMMEAEEDLKNQEQRLMDIKENLNRILLFCRAKGDQELKMKSRIKVLEENARRRDREVKEATAWLNICMHRCKNRDKLKRKVTETCKWVDTETVNGFHQRFSTELLRERLYLTYFQQIILAIVNNAEIVGTERRIMTLQKKLSINMGKLQEREGAMKNLLNDMKREEYMRTRRSTLNKKFFPRNRRKVLFQRFSGWMRFYMWNRGNKDAFKLKYTVLKQQMDIDRQFKAQLQTRKQKEAEAKEKKTQYDTSVAKKAFVTTMEKHKQRPIRCTNCLRYYVESQNHTQACEYHSKVFTMACPSTCINPGLTAVCSAHRLRRWTCCNSTKQEEVGCCRRAHMPPLSDPVYDKMMDMVNERDTEFLLSLEEKWQDAKQNEYESKLTVAKREKLFSMEDQLEEDKKTAERYHGMKWV